MSRSTSDCTRRVAPVAVVDVARLIAAPRSCTAKLSASASPSAANVATTAMAMSVVTTQQVKRFLSCFVVVGGAGSRGALPCGLCVCGPISLWGGAVEESSGTVAQAQQVLMYSTGGARVHTDSTVYGQSLRREHCCSKCAWAATLRCLR